MNKNFTLFYVINNFSNNKINDSEKNIINIDFKAFNDVYKTLNKLEIEPSQNAIDNIMCFSKSYDVIKLKSLKTIELNLN
ncbi:MAG: hypothetical protein DRJ01_04775 [Bacteroidetes bacterium]|nr:MAG: hypothetical protein DRJ01_04775 [Bacteroidota bacterium]